MTWSVIGRQALGQKYMQLYIEFSCTITANFANWLFI